MANGHAQVLNPLAAVPLRQGPPQQVVRPLLMSDSQCLSLMAAIKGGDSKEAVDWSINTLARVVVAIKGDAIGKEIERITRELENASRNESQRMAIGPAD